jgi:hypothetical protein
MWIMSELDSPGETPWMAPQCALTTLGDEVVC